MVFYPSISFAILVACLLVCSRGTLACRRGRPKSDLSSRESLDEEVLISPSDGSCTSLHSGLDQYGKILSSHDQSQSQDIFNVSILCDYVIQAKPPYQRVMLDFRWFDVSRRYLTDPSCEHAGVTFYDGPSEMTPILRNKTCGSQRPQLLTSSQSALSMHIYASGNLSVVDFRAVYSSFSNDTFCNSAEETEPRLLCTSTERCISKTLSCDRQGVSNCGDEDYSDQLNELAPSFCPVTYDIDWTPLIITLACVAALGIPVLLYWCCWRPGYIPWFCGAWRRSRCCELDGCCTTPSRHLCRGACSCRGCAGGACFCCPGAVGPQRGNAPSRSVARPRKLGKADLIPGHPGPRSGRHGVNSPNNVFLVVDDTRGTHREKGGEPLQGSKRNQHQHTEVNQPSLENQVLGKFGGDQKVGNPSEAHADRSRKTKVIKEKAQDLDSGPPDASAWNARTPSSRNNPSKVHSNPSRGAGHPVVVQSGFHWDPTQYYPGLYRHDGRSSPAEAASGAVRQFPTAAHSDGAHVREGR